MLLPGKEGSGLTQAQEGKKWVALKWIQEAEGAGFCVDLKGRE